MKKATLIFVLISCLWSCSEKIDLIGDFKETAVVYGLLDHSDSLHYIKITRAFIGPGNALEIAQIADSSYFDVVEATIEEIENGVVNRTWILRDTIIDNKDTNGVFYAPEQKVYYFKTLPTTVSSSGVYGTVQTSPNPMMTSLNPNAEYKLKAILNNGEFEVTGQTELVNGITTTASSQNFRFKFASNPGEYKSTGVTTSNTGNSYIINAKIGVLFNEFIGTDHEKRSFEWQIGESDVLPFSSKTFSALGQTFYTLVKNNVAENDLIDKRTFVGFQIQITGGSEELYNYITVNQPTSSLAQSKPIYTNLEVTDGYRVIGLFSAIQTVKTYRPFYVSPQQAFIRAIDKNSTRELCEGPITGLLHFCSNHPADNVVGNEESFSCP
jgi:hypothetical protein